MLICCRKRHKCRCTKFQWVTCRFLFTSTTGARNKATPPRGFYKVKKGQDGVEPLDLSIRPYASLTCKKGRRWSRAQWFIDSIMFLMRYCGQNAEQEERLWCHLIEYPFHIQTSRRESRNKIFLEPNSHCQNTKWNNNSFKKHCDKKRIYIFIVWAVFPSEPSFLHFLAIRELATSWVLDNLRGNRHHHEMLAHHAVWRQN